MFFYMAECCDTPQSKERRNREYKVCLNERAILRLLDRAYWMDFMLSKGTEFAMAEGMAMVSNVYANVASHGTTALIKLGYVIAACETWDPGGINDAITTVFGSLEPPQTKMGTIALAVRKFMEALSADMEEIEDYVLERYFYEPDS